MTDPTAPFVQRTADRTATAPVVATRPSIWRIAVGVLLGMLAYTLIMAVLTTLAGALFFGAIADQFEEQTGTDQQSEVEPSVGSTYDAATEAECDAAGGIWVPDESTCYTSP